MLLRLDGNGPLTQQLCRGLRGAILAGRLRPGERLPPSRRLATELVGDVPAAEDLAQETVVAALTARSPHHANIRTWLRGIARNLAAFGYRSESRRRRHEARAAELSPQRVAPSAADVCTQFALHSSVVDAVMDLEDKVRAVLLLRFWEDLSAREIASQLGQRLRQRMLPP